MDFCRFLNICVIWVKIGKNISKNLHHKFSYNVLHHAKSTNALKNTYIAGKFAKLSKISNTITQKQLEMKMIKKYLKKDMPEEKQKIISDARLIK